MDVNKSLKVLILVPRIDNSGPVKGAKALHNGLKKNGIDVTIVPIFRGANENQTLSINESLVEETALRKIWIFKKLVLEFSNDFDVKIITFCFHSDLLSFLAGTSKKSICSIRANLYQNYKLDFGFLGYLLAYFNYFIASNFAFITVLNSSMVASISRKSKNVRIIHNFIDEPEISFRHKSEEITRFIFVGSLTKRKAVLQLLDAFEITHKSYGNCELIFLGKGPLEKKLKNKIERLGLSNCVKLVGQVDDPFLYLLNADVFVLPSLSEGTSRAALEALYAGLPCILRDVDSNFELIQSDKQGCLFRGKQELQNALNFFVTKQNKFVNKRKTNLLPKTYRQSHGTQEYLSLLSEF